MEYDISIIDAPQESFSICANCAFSVAEGQNKMESRVVCSRIQNWVKENQTCSKWKSMDILLCNQDYFYDLINEIKAGFHHNGQLKRFYNDLSTKISEFENGK